MSGWQPIETAPRNTPVLVLLADREVRQRDWMHGPMQVAANRGRGWISIPGMWKCAPTHWMPLPPPPAKRLVQLRYKDGGEFNGNEPWSEPT